MRSLVAALSLCLLLAAPALAAPGVASIDNTSTATASGEAFDPQARTCAHRSAPFGTLLKVAARDTGAATVCRVNDRGPRHDGLVYLTKAAAGDLGMLERGMARVTIERIGAVGRTIAAAPAPVPVPRPAIRSAVRLASADPSVTAAQATAPAAAEDLLKEARRYLGKNPTGWGRLWCARFLAMIAPDLAQRVKNPNWARDWAALPKVPPKVGAIVVLTRGGGGHIGIVAGFDKRGNPIVVSGNHGGKVAEAVYSKRRVLAYVGRG